MRFHVRVLFIVVGLFSAMCRRTAVFRPHRDVSTPQGTVRGYLTPTHATYLGIPYVRAPIHQYRYKAPEPPPTWDGIFEASHKVKCPQPGEDGDENCLVINVFAPRHSTLLPVYVLVHDGDFKNGWGPHEPPHRILKEDYVVVTFNYRLGALGFLCLGTEDALGNAGLKDQIAALYWISNNIEYFGGDPGEIVLHGIKSAAISIELLLLSGLVDGFVHKVIVESDSALSPLSMTYDPIATAYQGAISVGYEGTTDTEELYKFYNQTSYNVLINIAEKFLPCFEDESYMHSLISFDPTQSLKEGKYVKVPIMITYTDINDTGNTTIDMNELLEDIVEILPTNLAFDNDMIKEQIGKIVKEFYFGNSVIEQADAEQRYYYYNYDVFVEYPVVKLAMLYAAKSPYMVYLLKFILETESLIEDTVVTNTGTILENLYTERNDEDFNLEKLVTLWRNFVKLGDPTPLTTTLIPVVWQPVVTEMNDGGAITNVPTLHFGNKLKMLVLPRNQHLLFWNNIYKKFYKNYFIYLNKSEDLDDND